MTEGKITLTLMEKDVNIFIIAGVSVVLEVKHKVVYCTVFLLIVFYQNIYFESVTDFTLLAVSVYKCIDECIHQALLSVFRLFVFPLGCLCV